MEQPRDFSVETTTMDGVAIVTVGGDVDMSQAIELRNALSEAQGPVVVDLHACTFMGSEGVRALLEGRRLAVEREQRFVLAVPQRGAVARLLEIVGGATIFNVETEVEAAVDRASSVDRRRGGDRRRPMAA